ncbi:HXXEE domain-containing protein [Terribacillus saccharophilus]|uniref:HXXEE domain-containing protein n=1 Tax=Terribacillus saccharophilus TaxID=361277 RepID=UPI003981C8CF
MEVLLFLIAFTLHNIEEALFLPAWSNTSRFQKTVEPKVFYFAVSIVTLVAYSIGILFLMWPENKLMIYLQTGLIGAMLINVIFPHTAAAIVERRYAPGILTGAVLLLPTGSIALLHMIQIAKLSILEMVFCAAATGIMLLGIIHIMFKLGEKIGERFDH